MKIWLSVTIYAMTVFFGPVSSYFESCIGERCFTIPGSNAEKDFINAKNWCNDRNSSLAVVNENTTQDALTKFLNSAQLNEQPKPSFFIDLQLRKNTRTWYLVSGSSYFGELDEQNENSYWYYGYTKTYSNVFKAYGSTPNSLRSFICEFESTKYSINSTNCFPYKERCFFKYENESCTWYHARERCRSNGGDLATFNIEPGISIGRYEVPFNTFWLNPSLSYWVGIRWRDWQWKSSGGGDEVIYSWWSNDKPNNINYECVCVDPNVNPAWGWTDCSCTEPRQFVCLKLVPTIATTVNTMLPATTFNTVSFPFANVTNSPLNALAIGLGVGIGGGVFLILLIVIIVVAVTLTRKRRRKNNGVESRHKVESSTATTTTNIELEASNGPDVYAQVVSTSQHPANKKPPNEVIYQQPEFSNNQNSTSSGSDPTNIRQGRVQSVMLEGSNDVYANATSAS